MWDMPLAIICDDAGIIAIGWDEPDLAWLQTEALHVSPGLVLGSFSVGAGPEQAGADIFN